MKSIVLLCVLVGFVFAELQFSIELSSDTYQRGEDLFVNWQVKNTKTFGLANFLRWGTPLEGEWNANMFEIIDENGNKASYQGRVLKRVPPQVEDYEMVAFSGKSGSLNLADGYNFLTTGTYTVTLKISIQTLDGSIKSIQSNSVSFSVLKADLLAFDKFHTQINYNGCSNSETNTVNNAISGATSASNNALAYMSQSTIRCTSTYEQWFGTYTSSRWSKIKQDFSNIYSRLNSKQFNIDCTCNQPGTYAFVYPTDPTHTIHLCPVFWSASSNKYSYNSQPGTLTHEMSHFNDVAGTEDYQYGVTGCLQLAADSPSVAVDNADSHEYFQESDPSC